MDVKVHLNQLSVVVSVDVKGIQIVVKEDRWRAFEEMARTFVLTKLKSIGWDVKNLRCETAVLPSSSEETGETGKGTLNIQVDVSQVSQRSEGS